MILDTEIKPGKSAAGFCIGMSLVECQRVVPFDTSKKLPFSVGNGYQVSNSVRLHFNSIGVLYAIWLSNEYVGAYKNIGIGTNLKSVESLFPIYYDGGDEMHYPDSDSLNGIAFYASEESLKENPDQIISCICIHDWELQDRRG